MHRRLAVSPPKLDEERQRTCSAGQVTQLPIVLTFMLKTYMHVNLMMQMAIKLSPLFAAFRSDPAGMGKERTNDDACAAARLPEQRPRPTHATRAPTNRSIRK